MKKLLVPLLLASSVAVAEPLVWEGSDRHWTSPKGTYMTVTDLMLADHDTFCGNVSNASRRMLYAHFIGVDQSDLPHYPLFPTGLVDEIYSKDIDNVRNTQVWLNQFELDIHTRCLKGVLHEFERMRDASK